MSPLLWSKNVSSSVVCSCFLDSWHSQRKVRWSIHNSGSSSSICPSSVRSLSSRGMCSLHHFDTPISRALKNLYFSGFLLDIVPNGISPHTEVLRIFVHSCLVEVTVWNQHWYTVLSVESSHIVSLYSLRRPNSDLMSGSSFRGSPLWVFPLISRVTVSSSTLFCSFSTISLSTSVSGDLERLRLTPQPIHLWMVWRHDSWSVRYKRSTWSSCASNHSLRVTSSNRLELSPSSSLSTFLDSRVRCTFRMS